MLFNVRSALRHLAHLRAIIALEVVFAALIIFVVRVAGLPPFIWFVLVIALVAAQSVVFYNVGRLRERLEL